MAGSVNKVIVVGNLGRDPESRSFSNGGKVVNLTVATSESWKDKNSGEWKESTEWHKVAIFNEHLANTAEKYLRKGSKVYIEGKLKTRKWQGKDGNDQYTTEVVLQGFDAKLVTLDSRQQSGGDQGGYGGGEYDGGGSRDYGGGSGGRASGAGGNSGGSRTTFDVDDDDVPF